MLDGASVRDERAEETTQADDLSSSIVSTALAQTESGPERKAYVCITTTVEAFFVYGCPEGLGQADSCHEAIEAVEEMGYRTREPAVEKMLANVRLSRKEAVVHVFSKAAD